MVSNKTENRRNIKGGKSRKELRKEKRFEKKQKKINFFTKKKELRDKWKKDQEPGRFVRIQKDTDKEEPKIKESLSVKEHNKVKIQRNINKEHELEKVKMKKLAKEMKRQRIRALAKDNEEEDKTIKQLEKKLKMNKRKSKSIPKSFVDCGLDYILDVCDSDNIQAAVTAEMNLKDSDSEYEEDLALITGKKDKENVSYGKKESDEDSYSEDDIDEDEDDFLDGEGEEEEEEEDLEAGNMSDDDIYETSLKKIKDNKFDSAKNKNPIETNAQNRPNIKSILKSNSKVIENREDNDNDLERNKRKSSENENITNSKKVRIQVDSNSESEFSDVEENEKEDSEEFWEDIYGRTRDKAGNVVQESKNKYIPPHLREKSNSLDSKRKEELEKIKKQLKGLLNRLAENNIHGISNQIDELYMKNSRNDMNETMLNLFQDSLIAHVHTPERLIMEHAMLIAILHANVGTEIGAFFLQNLVKHFDELHSHEQEIEDKKLDNLILLISHFYTFRIYNSELLYDILNRLCDSFKPKDIDLILVVLRSVGFTLRKDDPIALKQLILRVQKLANDASDMKDDARVRFMLDVLLGIKNNNMNKLPGYDPTHSEHLKKIIKTMFRKGNYVTELKISLEDILKADERGRWWIVGSAWSGPAPNSAADKEQSSLKSMPTFSQEVLELAKKQRMNTSNRKNIFCILMTAEDYLDAFEKLLRLGLKGQPEQEIIHVIIHCLLSENTYNPYYSLVAEQLCSSDRRHQMSIQFAVWDRFKELKSLKKIQISNLAKFLAHLFLHKSLPISVLKVVEFVELDKSGVRLIRQVLMSILLHEDKDSMIEVFNRISKPAKLSQLRQSLALFMHHFILRNKSKSDDTSDEEKLLRERVDQVIQVLNCSNIV
ncbi:hypothetical protein O3M35_009328 [Rhynocoris fuscipes]|uniref:MI domain-containing protein n=1 Tax=Rhynocoris fuscipes TaxID=488301 RepID=A0AAW1D3Y8_9HEMI